MAFPTDEEIRQFAYQLWEEDGSPEGLSDEYWYMAEKQLADEARRTETPPAFADDEGGEDTGATPPVRSAGPEAVRDKPGTWDKVDQNVDESFPSSDPPASNKFK